MKSKYLAKTLIKISEEEGEKISTEKFLYFLENRGLYHLLPQITFHLEREMEQKKHKKTVLVYSSHNLPDNFKEKIKKLVRAKDSDYLKINVKPDLIGGFVTEYKDFIYDFSIKNKLETLKKTLSN